jgi:hypothetical protein
MVRPDTPRTFAMSAPTVPLVIVLCGPMSKGRWPSPVPRMLSGKICTSSATSAPSSPGRAAVPTKSPGLMSVRLAAATPTIGVLGLKAIDRAWPPVVCTASASPFRPVMVPWMRVVDAACANESRVSNGHATSPAAPITSKFRRPCRMRCPCAMTPHRLGRRSLFARRFPLLLPSVTPDSTSGTEQLSIARSARRCAAISAESEAAPRLLMRSMF